MHIAIRQIKQVDNYHFEIEWSDGVKAIYRLSDLQGSCPCAGCMDQARKQEGACLAKVDEHVRAKAVRSVGRYAIKIDFTSGCSAGIYNYEMLRHL